jgi:hypothetical protein
VKLQKNTRSAVRSTEISREVHNVGTFLTPARVQTRASTKRPALTSRRLQLAADTSASHL